MGDMADYYMESLFDDDEYDDRPFYTRGKKKPPTYLEIEVKKIIAATAKAFLCRLDDDEEYWIPFSQIRENHEDFQLGDTECVLHITEWIHDRLEPVEKKSIFNKKARGDTDA